MKHTKGKWEVIQEGLDPALPSKGYLSIQPIDAYIDHGRAPITDEDRANAQLIATAPDLLKLIQEILPSVKCIKPSGNISSWISRAQQVIAKEERIENEM